MNTTIDADHIGGNEAVAKSGSARGRKHAAGDRRRTGGAPILAHENLLNRLSESGASPASLPTDTYFVKQKDLFVNGEPVQLLHVPAAHTDGDTMVFFRRSDVISAGDVFTPDRYPIIDLARGGSINGLIGGHQPHPRARRARVQRRGRDDDRPRPRPPVRRVGRQRLPRHGDDRPRPRRRTWSRRR